MTDRDKIIKLNKSKHLIKPFDLVISVKYGNGYVTDVLYDEDVWNPIGVNFNGKTIWVDVKGGSVEDEGDAKFYRKIKL